MRQWALTLHFYQPPTQDQTITREILESCYHPIADLLLSREEAKLTFNLAGSLLRQIEAFGERSFLDKVNTLVNRGQVELLVSPMYHPLLPLTPATVGTSQIEEHRKLLQALFPRAMLRGIYPPELAMSAETLAITRNSGQFCLIDESSINERWAQTRIGEACYVEDKFYLLASSRAITELLRSYPGELPSRAFADFLFSHTTSGQVVVSVNDAELFGHHYSERIHFLAEILKGEGIRFITLGEAISECMHSAVKIDTISPSTWETSKKDAAEGNYWPLWLSPENDLQKKYQELAKAAFQALQLSHDSSTAELAAREHYNMGISSCHSFWLSNRRWWHPDVSVAGATQLIKCIRSLPIDTKIKRRGEELYHGLIHAIWQHHWSGEVEKTYESYDRLWKKFLKTLPALK